MFLFVPSSAPHKFDDDGKGANFIVFFRSKGSLEKIKVIGKSWCDFLAGITVCELISLSVNHEIMALKLRILMHALKCFHQIEIFYFIR